MTFLLASENRIDRPEFWPAPGERKVIKDVPAITRVLTEATSAGEPIDLRCLATSSSAVNFSLFCACALAPTIWISDIAMRRHRVALPKLRFTLMLIFKSPHYVLEM